MSGRLRRFGYFVVMLFVGLSWVGLVSADPVPMVSLQNDGDYFIGSDPINLSVTFDNTAPAGASNIGYGPFIDLYLSASGEDGDDGVTFINGSATYLGVPVTTEILTFPAGPLGGDCPIGQSSVTHPYAQDINSEYIQVCGNPGDQLIVMQLPFGSFTPEQPPATVDFQVRLSAFADLGQALPIYARGGFQFGLDPLDNPCCDPSFFDDSSPDTMEDNPVGAITPTLITIEKSDLTPEGEVATGPNNSRAYEVTIEVAPGQAVTDLDVSDYIDDNIVVTGINAPGAAVTVGGISPTYPVGPVVADGIANQIVVTYPSVVNSVSFTIDYYVPLLDVNNAHIVGETDGTLSQGENRVNAVGDWTPADPRDAGAINNAIAGDQTCPACAPTVTHTNEALVVQKSNSFGSGNPRPGDVITYTLNVQMSDFFALDDVRLYDVISDGQRLTGNPVMTFTQHGDTFSNAVNVGNFAIREYFAGGTPGAVGSGTSVDPEAGTVQNGSTVLSIDISAEIFDERTLNELLGGCVPAGGIGNPNPPDCVVFNGGATSISITYQTTVQDIFSNTFPSGDDSVDHGDELENAVTIVADTVLNTDDLSAYPTSAVENGSGNTLYIAEGFTDKAIYAIYSPTTGTTTLNPTGVPEITPGDVITFRLRYEMPSTDFEDFSLSDYLPLPVLSASEMDIAGFDDVISDGSTSSGTGIPLAGRAMWGPTGQTDSNTNFRDRITATGVNLENGGTTPIITKPGGTVPAACGGTAINSAENSINFCFGDYDDTTNQDSVIDILFSVTVTDDPFADELFLTNFVRGGTGATNTDGTESDEIVRFVLRQPILMVRKGVLDSNNPNESFTETPNSAFAGAGEATVPPFSGTIESDLGTGSGNVDNGTDADVDGLDADDLVRFVISIQNTGGAAAYDITLHDVLPAGLPASSVQNFNITLGDGTALGYTRPDGSGASPADFFNPAMGIRIVDPSEGVCQSPYSDPAEAVILITYDLQIDNTVAAGDILTNTTTVTHYANSEGGPSHLDDPDNYPTDSAEIEIAGTVDKDIIRTSEADSSDTEAGVIGDERPVMIGEVVTYRVYTRIAEGTSNNIQLRDNTPNGLQFIPNSANFAFLSSSGAALSSSDPVINGASAGVVGTDPTFPALDSSALVPVPVSVISGGTTAGDDLLVSFGNVANSASDDAVEWIVLEFDMLVVDIPANQAGTILPNTATLRKDGADLVTSDTDTSDDDNDPVALEIIEPDVIVGKSTINDTGLQATDSVGFELTIRNIGTANAYDVVVTDTLPNDGTLNFGSFSLDDFSSTCDELTGWNLQTAFPDVTFSFDQLDSGDDCTITFFISLTNLVEPNTTYTNTAEVTSYDTLPDGDDPNNRESSGNTDTSDYTTANIQVFKNSFVTSEAHTDPTGSQTGADAANAIPLVIGEVIHYEVLIGTIDGTHPDLTLTDALPAGLRLLKDSNFAVTLPTFVSSDNPDLPTGITIPLYDDNGVAQVTGVDQSTDTTVILTLGNVLNTNSSASSLQSVIINFSAVVENTAGNTINTELINQASANTANDQATADSNQVYAIVQEPDVTATKIIFGTPPDDAFETVTYDITVTAGNATNQSTAYEVRVVDDLNADLRLDSVALQSASDGDITIIETTSELNQAGGQVNLVLSQLEPGEQAQIRVVATVLTSVSPGEDIDNLATVTWTSVPGDNGTNDATPGDSGAEDGERTGDETGENDYITDSNTVTFIVVSPQPIKSIDGTSELDTSDDPLLDGTTDNERPVAIGETVTYRLVVNLPESTSISFAIDDVLVEGIEYVNGSARVSYLADSAPTFNGDFSGITNATEPTFAFPSNRITFGVTAPRQLTFDFGSVINNDGDANAELIIVEFDVVVIDNVVNTVGQIWANDFSVLIDEGFPTETRTPSNSVSIEVVEPAPTITKTFTPDEQIRGQNVTMTLVVSNLAVDGANASLFDIEVVDILDDWLDVTNIDFTFNTEATNAGSTFENNSSINAGFASGVTDDIRINIDQLPVDGVATITVTMQIDPNADPLSLPRVITNQATLTGDTLVSDEDPDDEDRDYSETATDDLNVVKPTLLVTKIDSVDPVAAGAAMSYTVTIENTGTPDFDATNVVFVDELPTSFIVTLVQPSQGTCSPIVAGALTCQLGTIASGASANIVINGRFPATTPDGTIATNIAYVDSSTEGNAGNDGNDTPDDGDDERAEEATTIGREVDLQITKIVDDATPNEGDLITYTIDLTNIGSSEATDIVVTDTLPLGVSFVQFVPATAPCSFVDPFLTCDYAILNAGQSRTIGIEATVDAGTAGTQLTNTVTVSANEPESDLTNNEDDAIINVDSVDLRVTKTVNNPTPSEGATIEYTINLTNLGPAPATGVQVTDDLNTVNGVTYLSDNSATVLDSEGNPTSYNSGTGIWSVSDLDIGDSVNLVITATVDVGASALPQPIVNTATLTASDQPDTNPANDQDDASISPGGLDLSLTKGVNNPTPTEGGVILYSIIVQNLGAANATNIIVLDQLDGLPVTYVSHTANQPNTTYDLNTGQWTIPSLNAGQSIRLDITVTVNTGTAGTTITNTASIDSVDQTDVNPDNDTDDATVNVRQTDVAINKTVDNATPAEGDTVIYSITATNTGAGDVTGLTVADALPAGVTYVSDNSASLLNGSNAPTSYDAGSGLWTIGTLTEGNSLTLEITVTVDGGTSGTTITNTASLDGMDQTDTNPNNNDDDAVIAVEGLDLIVTKTVDNATPSEGDTIIYSITVENAGPVDATTIQITDALPTGVTYVSDNSASVLDSATNPTSYNSGTGVWSIGALTAGQSLTLEITATVDNGTSGDTIINTATLTASDQNDSDPDNNEDDAPLTVGGVDIAVTKIVDNPTPASGDDVTYTITVSNIGGGTATGVTITEDLPLDNVVLTYVSDTPSQGTFTPGTPGTWDIGTLTAGQTVTLDLTVTVNIVDGQVLNVASLATVDQPDTNPDNNEDDASVTIGGVDLAVEKSVDNPIAETGDTVIYTIVASNVGATDATGVVVVDILPAGVTYVDDNSDELTDDLSNTTVYDPITGDWTIGQLNAGSSLTLTIEVTVNVNGGQVLNTADISGNEPESDPDNNRDEAIISVDSADLSLTKNVSTTTPQVGDFITYTVTVNNAGPNIAYNVAVTDYLPSTVTYSGVYTASQGTFDGSVWTVGTLSVNGAATLEITVQVTSNVGTFVNIAEVTASDQSDPDSTPNNGNPGEDDYDESGFLFDPPFGRKVFNAQGLPELEWTIIWVNPNDEPLSISVNDPVIAGTTYINGSLTCTSPGTLVTTNCSYDIITNAITFNGTIFPDPGITPATINQAVNPLVITYRVRVAEDVTEVRNEAFLTSVNGDNVSVSSTWQREAEEPTPAPAPAGQAGSITLTKYAEPMIAFPGEMLTWILEVSNPSGVDVNGVVITDQLPTALTVESTSADAGGVAINDQLVTWDAGTVSAGQTLRLRIITRVSPNLTEPVTNTAFVVGNGVEPQESTFTTAFIETLPATGERPWLFDQLRGLMAWLSEAID